MTQHNNQDLSVPLVCPDCGTDRGTWVPGANLDGSGMCEPCLLSRPCRAGCGTTFGKSDAFINGMCSVCWKLGR